MEQISFTLCRLITAFFVHCLDIMSRVLRKPAFAYPKTGPDHNLCFRYRDSTISRLKFQATICHLWLYSLVCVRSCQKPRDRFCHDAAHVCNFKPELVSFDEQAVAGNSEYWFSIDNHIVYFPFSAQRT